MEIGNLIEFNILKNRKKKVKSKVNLAMEGDKEAFIFLIEENMDFFYRVSKRILQNEYDVEDAVQNMIIKAYENIENLKNEEYFKTWITRILINECNKILNKRNKIIPVSEIFAGETSDEKIGEIDLKEAIKTLNLEFRVVIELFYFEDLSINDISKILNIPKGTVKSRLSRGKEKLFKIIGGV
ncbi:sigma-70 family RNA polymerase sigma factor [Clostridium perfringens]|nr:sigma-70 family RNA polymerase sigma factor [Clostridium perfringens]